MKTTPLHIENLLLKQQILQLQAVVLEMQHKEVASLINEARTASHEYNANNDADNRAHSELIGVPQDGDTKPAAK